MSKSLTMSLNAHWMRVLIALKKADQTTSMAEVVRNALRAYAKSKNLELNDEVDVSFVGHRHRGVDAVERTDAGSDASDRA